MVKASIIKKKQGIGLKNIKSRVHEVHGKISIDSKLGTGTKISILIPLQIKLMPKYNVLLVDDHPMIIAGFEQALEIIKERDDTLNSLKIQP